ncbi:DUF979 domain-containing protein [Sphingomonas jeddahensis]|uniref:DUF979 domain-containing protein n=1 Tax=Sphingomonas jeddahensis TaxID=1915074 RepID=A0A1V2ERP7_9SPHN|nr:DUF979 domain-containing protein [Sphingomonas jeddahensis]ONF95155.1 hypothetical protein SPHI_26940 [Sphingomonas jeddahensis]
MIGLNFIYGVAGLTFLAFALLGAAEKRWANATFHGLIATSFLLGDWLGDIGNGVLVLALVAIAASGRMKRRVETGEPRARGAMVFVPALVIPVTALLGTLLFKQVPWLVDPRQATLVALTVGVLLALALCYVWLRPAPAEPFRAGRALMDDIGWAAVLPQMLASLGAVFALAGVGEVVGRLIGVAIPAGSVIGAVLAFGLGMALFTIVMGNAFAAFPVMAAAVGIPLLVQTYGADPAPVAAIGMLAGFCGTLMTPMAANFNLVPAALLELKDRNGVIRAQVPTALPLLAFNIILLWWIVA